VDLGLEGRRGPVPGAEAAVILLDTNALIWIDQNHRRTRTLVAAPERLAVSPASLLELRFLIETGRLGLRRGSVEAIAHDDR
jgi:PIN domain nuclease of toxin-antitoxin system